MARPIDRIEREIAELEKAIAALSQDFYTAYSGYLAALGQTIRQQLILASYHVCTQGYPEEFLKLSLTGREKLQTALRQLTKKTQTRLATLLEAPEPGSEAPPSPLQTEAIVPSNLPEAAEKLLEHLSALSQKLDPSPGHFHFPSLTKPEDLARSQERLERTIQELIYTVSRDANRLLRQAEIIPNQLPEPILEAAQSASSGEVITAGPPNILNLWIEAEGPIQKHSSLEEALQEAATQLSQEDPEAIADLDSSEEEPHPLAHLRTPLRIVAVHLRLSELEFTDASLASWRQKIRSLKNQLNTLGRDYHKKQRELAVARAEAAWRSTWLDE